MNNSIKKKTPANSSFTRTIIDLESFKKSINFNKNHGVCGSYNLGNTCFMNSSIACLSNCSELTEYFLTKQYEDDINRKNVDGARGKLAEEWYNLLYQYWNSNIRVGNPKNIKRIVGSKNRKFLGDSQQDSNEFMTVFLEILGEDLNRATKKIYIELKEQQKDESDIDAAKRFWGLHVRRNDSIVTDLFHGLFKSTITCPRCSFKNITYDPFNTLALTIPDLYTINKLQQKKRKNIKRNKKKKEKEIVHIYYVPPFSLIQTKKFEIEIYKEMTLNQIAKEIQKRSDKIISTNLKFISVSNKECEKFLDPKKPKKDVAFIFSYEKEDRGNSNYAIPIYLCDSNKLSAYPRLLFFNRNTNYYEFKKKIYILIRKYLKSPFYEENKKEEFEEDKELSNYIEGKSNKLDKVLSLIEKEFHLLQKNYSNFKRYIKNPPYKIYFKKKLSNSSAGEYIFSEGDKDDFELLSQFRINSDNDYVDIMLDQILNRDNQIYLMVKLNNKSKFVKKDLPFDNCLVEKCSQMKEEDEDVSYEREMEIEEEDEYAQNITLDHCLQYFTDEESLEEGNEWYCNKCRKRVTASKQIELFYLPRIMCICLTRFLKKGRFYDYTKNNSLVDFPLENLNMEKYICGPDKKNSKYDLFAVSQHYGGMGGGHYTAVCKNIDGKWYDYDDSNVSKASSSDICTPAAYVLFYRRQSW